MQYTITVSGAELEVLSFAIGRIPTAKPIVARQSKAAPRSTGPNPWEIVYPLDDISAEWIRERATRNFTPRYPKFVKTKAEPTRWTKADRDTLDAFNYQAISAWRRLGHEVIVSGANVSVRPLTTTD